MGGAVFVNSFNGFHQRARAGQVAELAKENAGLAAALEAAQARAEAAEEEAVACGGDAETLRGTVAPAPSARFVSRWRSRPVPPRPRRQKVERAKVDGPPTRRVGALQLNGA